MSEIFKIHVEFVKESPVRYGNATYNFDMKLPGKKHLAYITHSSQKCFLYAIAHFFIGEEIENPYNGNSPEYFQFFKTLNLDHINFPLSIGDIKRFVNQNRQLDISINILGYFNGSVYTMHLDIGSGNSVINLLALDIFDSETMQGVTHQSTSYEHLMHITNIDLFLRERYPGESRNYKFWRHWCLKW